MARGPAEPPAELFVNRAPPLEPSELMLPWMSRRTTNTSCQNEKKNEKKTLLFFKRRGAGAHNNETQTWSRLWDDAKRRRLGRCSGGGGARTILLSNGNEQGHRSPGLRCGVGYFHAHRHNNFHHGGRSSLYVRVPYSRSTSTWSRGVHMNYVCARAFRVVSPSAFGPHLERNS